MSHFLDNYWKSRGFEVYNHNIWIKYNSNKFPKYFATYTSKIDNNVSTLKFFIRDVDGNELLASNKTEDIDEFFKKLERDDKIDEILD